jgi:hypothetical protein
MHTLFIQQVAVSCTKMTYEYFEYEGISVLYVKMENYKKEKKNIYYFLYVNSIKMCSSHDTFLE